MTKPATMRWKIMPSKKWSLARKTKLLTEIGAVSTKRSAFIVPLLVVIVAVYFFALSTVIGGALLSLLLRLATSGVFAAGLAAVVGRAAAAGVFVGAAAWAPEGICDASAAAPPGTAEA